MTEKNFELRVFGYILKKKKNIKFALKQIFGIGNSLSLTILKKLNINTNCKLGQLDNKVLKNLYNYIEGQNTFETSLKKTLNYNIDRLKYIKSYRGFRHLNNLPVRGQRTKTNARTSKNRRKFTSDKPIKKLWQKKKKK